MLDENNSNNSQTSSTTDSLKGWIMVILTFIFALLYVGALLGFIAPLADVSVITRLEPILFVIIGYYFGRLPAQANENTLKTEINRQNQKADAAQQVKEKTLQEREILEEKIKNARIMLAASTGGSTVEKMTGAVLPESVGDNRQIVEAAIKILDS